VTLLTAHRILIAVATLFFAFYAAWEWSGSRAAGGEGGVIRAAVALAGAVVLAVYFRSLTGGRVPPKPGGEGGG
jgi:hypothetical protein